MKFLFINYVLAFVEGFALIVSPCILPILPILLSGGIAGGRRRPWGIIAGFVIVFALFTFFSRALVQSFGINLDIVRQLAFVLIVLFGVVLVSDYLSGKFERLMQRVGNLGANLSSGTNQGGFLSGLLLGALVSLVWVPCGGPILAAAIVQTAIQKTVGESLLTFFFFALGSVVPMIIITLLGRQIIDRFSFLKTRAHLLRKIFGFVIIIGAFYAAFSGPADTFAPMPDAPNVVVSQSTLPDSSDQLIGGLAHPYPAPSIGNDGVWLNSPPLNWKDLKGKVVLIDFWTYSCINCVRTLPYLKAWYAKYAPDGFVIIGVHAPEFEFEKNLANVKTAVAKDGITYPVVLDNNYVIWSNYDNQYWPAHYLVDKEGNVVYQHFGEGNYAETEHNIQVLLGLKREALTKLSNNVNPVMMYNQTPETYLGYARDDAFYSVEMMTQDKTANYTYPDTLSLNCWALQGAWKIESQKITAMAPNATIKINFNASRVYVVGGSSNGKPIKVAVYLNGQPIADNDAGRDVNKGILTLTGQTLYQLTNLNGPTMAMLELKVLTPGAEFYTFTFGN
jgi:cytochrome c biogenesis protein CcdA/thiol-disulfide isomerase/thioredoxin